MVGFRVHGHIYRSRSIPLKQKSTIDACHIPSRFCIRVPELCACVYCSSAMASCVRPNSKRPKLCMSLSKAESSRFATPMVSLTRRILNALNCVCRCQQDDQPYPPNSKRPKLCMLLSKAESSRFATPMVSLTRRILNALNCVCRCQQDGQPYPPNSKRPKLCMSLSKAESSRFATQDGQPYPPNSKRPKLCMSL